LRVSQKKTARVFRNNRNQAVRLPRGFEFAVRDVFLRREGDVVMISPRPWDWTGLVKSDAVASDDFVRWVEEVPGGDGSCA